MTNIRNLMSCSDFWFIVKDEDDYHFPRVFKTPHPQRIGYYEDISLIPRYDAQIYNLVKERPVMLRR